MRKETINTFSDGMSLDLNPLGTPAKTLTNCLNGTLITYNGNELTLQNDMGNTKVGTAELPKGYVPVGMKEYGGIIYVASYNPETKKGQLGCFPSPQQIYVSEAAQTVLELNLQQQFIYDFFGEDNVPIIDYNEFKSEIFKDSNTQEPKIFNVGDKFIIKTEDNFSEVLREAIDKNIIVIKLFIIPTSGGDPIDISSCEKNELNLYQEYNSPWEKNLWIFQNGGDLYKDEDGEFIKGNIPFETILNNYRQFLQTYPGPQGTLEIVFEFNTFKLFNLYRKYKKLDNSFNVQFIGEAESDDLDECNPVVKETLEPLSLYGSINNVRHDLEACIKLDQTARHLVAYTSEYPLSGNQTLYYDILPTSQYGALKLYNNSFLKSGELTVEKLNNSHNKITNWNFEIDQDAVTLKWTYTTFMDDPEIDHMRFVLIPLDKVMEHGTPQKSQIDQLYITGPSTPRNIPNIYKIRKFIYSGDFEDRIEFVKDYVDPNYIYLCRLDVIYKDNSVVNGQEYKLLYTGTFFNDKDTNTFNQYNRPKVNIDTNLVVEQSYTIKAFNYTVISNINGTITEETTDLINANTVMFKADDEKYYKRIIGIVINAECEVTSTLSVDCDKFVKYNDESTPLRPQYAGNFDPDQTLDALAVGGEITCSIQDVTNHVFEGEGDEEIQKILQKKVKKATIVSDGTEVPLEGATIKYKKVGTTYQNTSIIKIHRGIISRFGRKDFHTVLLEGLFPVYDPNDTLYNERLFGFSIDEDGNLSNIIGGENFMGLSLWLAKNRKLDANTSMKDSMIEIERSYDKKTALSRFDFKGDAQTPYHYGSYISEGIGIVNYGSEGTSRIEAMQKCNYAPIQILASNEYERVWDKSYWDGDVDSRICNLMVLPHSEPGENLRTYNFEPSYSGKDKHYGTQALNVRTNYINRRRQDGIHEPIDEIGTNTRGLFPCSHGSTRSMYILWRSQYGYQIMNLATPLDIENNQQPMELITVKPNRWYNKTKELIVHWDKDQGETLPVADTHLRADHMLLCMLSQILITKKKNSDLLLNAPDIALIYQSLSFKTKGLLTTKNVKNPIITLNGKDIEKLISILLEIGVLDANDIFIPMFESDKYSNGYIDCGGKITNNVNRFGIANLEDLFYAEGLPEFSNVTDEERINIFPGVIESVFGTYLCKLKKDKYGLYEVNNELVQVVDGKKKFYKIFLPVIHSHTNKEGAKYNCKNYDIYKEILEGFAYNDVLFPLTRVLKEQGKEIGELNSQEDLENPFFNLLYYNSIELGFQKATIYQSNLSNGDIEVDFSHGFAFISLFGDQSRYLDADVFRRNIDISAPEDALMTLYGADYNNGKAQYGYNTYGNNAFRTFLFPIEVNLQEHPEAPFYLGTKDWATSKIDYTGGRSDNSATSDNPNTEDPQNNTLPENP